MNVWFRPLKTSAACFYRVADDGKAIQLVTSECGGWRTKVDIRNSIAASTKGIAPNTEICPKCARLLGITPKPQSPVLIKPELLSREERIPLEDMPARRRTPTPEDPPDELAGVDLDTL